MTGDVERLTTKLQHYAANISRGMESFPTAKNAGYSDSYAWVIATRTKRNHAVVQAIAHIRAEGMKLGSMIWPPR